MSTQRIKTAILGTGNIGSDLMLKILRQPDALDLVLMAGIDPNSAGLARARDLGVPGSPEGIEAVLADPEIGLVFDATSAYAHRETAPQLEEAGKRVIDLTPAAIGPYIVPLVNQSAHADATNVNLITCGGQATIPIVHAVSRVTPVAYAEIVSTVASASAGPGTRQNIDEFTFTTARGLEVLGGAASGKALIILNPADPPILMRNTVYVLPQGEFDEGAVTTSIERMVTDLQAYVPGYRMKGAPVFDDTTAPIGGGRMITVLLEVEGAGDFLPPYAGNLDIMTASAWRVGQEIATTLLNPTSKESA